MSNPARQAHFFEWYAQHVWPIHRQFVKSVLAKRCIRCNLPETHTPLVHGVCVVCTKNAHASENADEKITQRARMSDEMDHLLQMYAGRGKEQYDCLVLFSGGKDSIYLVHTLRTRFPELRIMALLVNNSFLPEIAITNAREIASKLRLAFTIISPSPAFYEKVFRHAFLNLDGKESAIVVDQFDGDILYDTGRNYAARYKIPLIVSGIQDIQVERYVEIATYETPRSFEESRRTHIRHIELESFLTPEELKHFWDGTKWPKQTIPRMLYPFYAWGYDENNVRETVSKLNILSKEDMGPLTTNHYLVPLMAAVDIKRLGYSSYDYEFSRLVRDGRADRIFWRSILEMQEYSIKTNRFVTASIDLALKRLSLTKSQLGI